MNQYKEKYPRFVDCLAFCLQRESGIQISTQDFDFDNIPQHLKMKYQFLGVGKKQAQNKISTVWPKATATTHVVVKGKQEKTTRWCFKSFSVERNIENKGVVTRSFIGLKDCNSYVEEQSYSTMSQALEQHKQGLGRLLVLSNQSSLNKIMRGWPDRVLLEKLSLRSGGFSELFDALCIAFAHHVITEPELITEPMFKTFNAKFAQGINQFISDYLNQLMPLIKLREKAFIQLGELNSAVFKSSIEEIRTQLNFLWAKTTLINISASFLDDYNRYHKAILTRIKRIKENYPKEAEALDVWLDWQDWWNSIVKHENSHTHPEKNQSAKMDAARISDQFIFTWYQSKRRGVV